MTTNKKKASNVRFIFPFTLVFLCFLSLKTNGRPRLAVLHHGQRQEQEPGPSRTGPGREAGQGEGERQEERRTQGCLGFLFLCTLVERRVQFFFMSLVLVQSWTAFFPTNS